MQDNQKPNVITIEYSISRQPEPYNNVRFAVSVPVSVNPEDDPVSLLAEHAPRVQRQVENEIDLMFEGFGHPAPYDPVPRFRVVQLNEARVKAIIPNDILGTDLPFAWIHATPTFIGHRLEFIRGKLAHTDWPVIDCSDGDLSKLPQIESYHLYRNHPIGVLVWTTDKHDIPSDIRARYPGYFQMVTKRLSKSDILAAIDALARENNYDIIDCRDGDWSKLPPPPQAETVNNNRGENYEDEDKDDDCDNYDEEDEAYNE